MIISEIVVEDGTGTNPLANSFINLEYFYQKSILYLKEEDVFNETSIVRAIYISHYYLSLYYKWHSVKLIESQPLFFPRVNNFRYKVILQTVPENIKLAIVVLSCYILKGLDILNVEDQLRDPIPKTKGIKVDDLAIEYNIDNDLRMLQNRKIRLNDVEGLIKDYCSIPLAFAPRKFHTYF